MVAPTLAGPDAGRRRTPRRRLLCWLGWFGVAEAALLLLVSLRNLAVADPPEGATARLFTVAMFVGQASFLAFVPLLPLLVWAVLWPRERPLRVAATVVAALVLFAAVVDTIIFRQYRFHLNAEVFNLLFGGAAGEILVFSRTMYAQVGLLLVAIVVLLALIGRLVWRRVAEAPRRRLGATVAAVLTLSFAGQALVHAWADVAGFTPVTREARLLLAYVPWTAESLFERLGLHIERADDAALAADHGTSLAYPRHPLRCSTAGAHPNILFVVIDSWRFDALSEAATPNVARLAESGLVFTDHRSGGSATRTGIFSLFYGLPGTYWHAMLAERRGPVLISELYRQGYEVSIFASAKLVNPEFHRTVFADVPDLRLRSDGRAAWERDRDSNRDFLEFLDTRAGDRPFFSMLFYDAPHAYSLPDDAPEPFQPSWDHVNYLALDNDFDPLPFHNRYLNCVRFDDALIGDVLRALEARGLMDDTLILVTGDHGQEFNENHLDYWGHDGNFSRWQVGVPLVIHWPGRGHAVYDHRTSHFDVAPTLLRELFSCENEISDYGVGRDLFEPGGRELLLLANYTDYAVVQPDRILAVHPWGVETLDPSYRRIPAVAADREAMLAAMRLRSRFYR